MLSALLLATKIVLTAKAPFVVENKKIVIVENGDHERRIGTRLVVENPLSKAVVVDILCNGKTEYETSEVKIAPLTTETIDIEATPPADSCDMLSWRVVQP